MHEKLKIQPALIDRRGTIIHNNGRPLICKTIIETLNELKYEIL